MKLSLLIRQNEDGVYLHYKKNISPITAARIISLINFPDGKSKM